MKEALSRRHRLILALGLAVLSLIAELAERLDGAGTPRAPPCPPM